ncbi:hypothetical protein M3Y96_00107000 [Aphelenchoides besseyi]|nr:hypothetical protein M3Y96_00107000 [Aphelenchoides besseyi]
MCKITIEKRRELVLHRELYNADVLWSLTEAVYIQSTARTVNRTRGFQFGYASSTKTSLQFAVDFGIKNTSSFIETRKKVRDSLRSGTFKRSSEELGMIARILIGKMESFEKCGRNLYDFWYELLPAYVLFTCPGADLDNIGKIAQTLQQTLCPTDTHISTVETMNTEIDRPIFSILCKKLPEMLKQICENSVSWWFPVHLCDPFQKLDPSVIMMLGERIQKSAGRETANFGAAGNEGLQPQRQRLNADEIVRTSMIIDYGTALLESYAENGHYNEALSWALRSELSDLINLVSNKMLATFNAEAISQWRIFDATSTMFLNYPNLLLLQRFYQFGRFLVRGQASEAAGKLYELVTSGMAPIAFQVVLLDQMTKLLDPSTTDFIQVPELDRDSIYDLMKAVNNFELQDAIIHPSKTADSPHTVELQTKIKFLRPALCSALALRSLS